MSYNLLKIIADEDLLEILDLNEKIHFTEFLNKKEFRVADLPFSYKQVSDLGKDGVIDDKNKKEQSWRRFSFKEMVFLFIVKELKDFGLKNNQIKEIGDSYFQKPIPNKGNIVDIALVLSLLRKYFIILTVDNNDKIKYFTDKEIANNLAKDLSAFIGIRINSITENLANTIINDKSNNKFLYNNLLKIILTDKEIKLINILRKRQYIKVTIKKKNGDISTVYAEENNQDNFSEKNIIQMLRNKSYGSIQVMKRDDKIVVIKSEDTFKL